MRKRADLLEVVAHYGEDDMLQRWGQIPRSSHCIRMITND